MEELKGLKTAMGNLLDAKRILADLIHEGITSEESQIEVLHDELRQRYGKTSDDEELWGAAELYRAQFIEDAEFLAKDEAEEASETYRARESALADTVEGRW